MHTIHQHAQEANRINKLTAQAVLPKGWSKRALRCGPRDSTPACASARLKQRHTPANAENARTHAPLIVIASATAGGSF